MLCLITLFYGMVRSDRFSYSNKIGLTAGRSVEFREGSNSDRWEGIQSGIEITGSKYTQERS